jgi:hemoglobin
MDLPISPIPPSPRDAAGAFGPGNTPFDTLGGIERVRELVDRFYMHMANDRAFAATRDLYPPGDLSASREKLFAFLAGWLGGPQLYTEKHGHPRLRGRHMPFAIDETARDHWLACMTRAMDEMRIQGDLRTFLDQRFRHVANFLRNQ